MFIDCPSEFIIKLPSYESHEDRPYCNNARNGNKERSRVWPSIGFDPAFLGEIGDGILNLVHLHGGVDEESEVEETKADYLNRVLEAQSVVHKE